MPSRAGRRSGFHVVGVGAAGPVVLHAALLDEHGLIKKVTLERSLVSWADIVERASAATSWATWSRACFEVVRPARPGGPAVSAAR